MAATCPQSQQEIVVTLTGQDLNLLNTEMQGCIVGGCVAMGGDTHCAGGTQNWPDFMNPNVNPRFCQIGMANGLEDPTQYGCTSWGPESCKWTQRNVSWPDTAVCCSLGELGGAPCDNTQYPVAANPSFAVCVKTGYDPAFRKACCFGDATDVALQCDPAWCPYDPQGACTDLFMAECGGASACGRHKFLTPSVTADQGGAPCNAWYLGVKDNAVDGAYWTRSFTDAVTGSVTVVPSSLSLDPLLSVTAEIARYCAAEGATNGECSCYNAVTACTAGQGGTPGCLIAADTGDADGALRRVDVYCNSGFSTTTDAGKWVTLSNTCGIADAESGLRESVRAARRRQPVPRALHRPRVPDAGRRLHLQEPRRPAAPLPARVPAVGERLQRAHRQQLLRDRARERQRHHVRLVGQRQRLDVSVHVARVADARAGARGLRDVVHREPGQHGRRRGRVVFDHADGPVFDAGAARDTASERAAAARAGQPVDDARLGARGRRLALRGPSVRRLRRGRRREQGELARLDHVFARSARLGLARQRPDRLGARIHPPERAEHAPAQFECGCWSASQCRYKC